MVQDPPGWPELCVQLEGVEAVQVRRCGVELVQVEISPGAGREVHSGEFCGEMLPLRLLGKSETSWWISRIL